MSKPERLVFQDSYFTHDLQNSLSATPPYLLGTIIGGFILLKALDYAGFPVTFWLRRLVKMAADTFHLDGLFNDPPSDSEASEASTHSGGLLTGLFGLNPGGLLQKGVRGVAGAFSTNNGSTPPGLGNLSNSCYQNSVIQGLASLPSLRAYLSNLPFDTTDSMHEALNELIQKLNDPANSGQHFWVRGKLKSMSIFQQQDAQEYYSKILDALDEEVKKASKSRRRSSVSWSEATKSLVDGDKGDSEPRNTNDNADSTPPREGLLNIVPNPLDGLLAQRVGCVSCGYSEGLSLIPFNCVTVALGRNYRYDIRECLDEYTTLEYIDGVECAKCTLLKLKNTLGPLAKAKPESIFVPRYKAVLEALEDEDFEDKTLIKTFGVAKKNWVQSTKSKQAVIARAPKSLVLHVNRSSFNEMTGEPYKNSAAVAYPSILDLGNWCLGSQPSGSRHPDTEEWARDPKESLLRAVNSDPLESSPFQYRLRAAVTHYGSHGNGHYVCYRPHAKITPPPEKDSENDDVEDESVQEEDNSGESWWRFSDESVYPVSEEAAHQGNVFMLFYERIDESDEVPMQDTEGVAALERVAEDALLPPLDIGDSEPFEDVSSIPLPDDDDLLDIDELTSPGIPTINPQAPPQLADATSPASETSTIAQAKPISIPAPVDLDMETETSEAESDDAPSTQVTSDNESEFDLKDVSLPKISPHLMRTAGDTSDMGQGSRQSLPLVSAT